MQGAASAATLPSNTLEITLAVAMTLLVAGAAAMVAGSVTRRLLRTIEGEHVHVKAIGDATVRIVRRITFAIVALLVVFPALDFAGVDISVGLSDQDAAQWAARTGVRVAMLLLLAFATNRFAASVIRRAEREIVVTDDARGFERRRRAQTLGSTFGRFLSALIWSTAVLVILRELDVDITPVLTGAGILGLAVGFGAQTLVKDMISGIFVIAEDQVRVGDTAIINGVEGTVEHIHLRTLALRTVEGVVYTFSNGDIRTMANRSKGFAYYVLAFGLEYDQDSDAVVRIVTETAAGLQADPDLGPWIIDPIEVMGMDDLTGDKVTMKFRIKTVPLKQGDIGRELRRRVKQRFHEEGIRMPGARMEITLRNSPVPDPRSPIPDP
jgi:small-conductance mechanosensitive channel